MRRPLSLYTNDSPPNRQRTAHNALRHHTAGIGGRRGDELGLLCRTSGDPDGDGHGYRYRYWNTWKSRIPQCRSVAPGYAPLRPTPAYTQYSDGLSGIRSPGSGRHRGT